MKEISDCGILANHAVLFHVNARNGDAACARGKWEDFEWSVLREKNSANLVESLMCLQYYDIKSAPTENFLLRF